MSDQEALQVAVPAGQDLPDPAREALDKPHLSAESLKGELGDSEPWDEASQEKRSDAPEDDIRSADRSAV